MLSVSFFLAVKISIKMECFTLLKVASLGVPTLTQVGNSRGLELLQNPTSCRYLTNGALIS